MDAVRRSKDEWLEMISEQRASGLSIREWCESNEVNHNTMKDWARRLRKEGSLAKGKPNPARRPSGSVPWVEAVPVSRPPSGGTEYLVGVGGFAVTVPANFEKESLLRLCRALSELC